MRRAVIRTSSPKRAASAAPWARVITRAASGFIAFESAADFWTWRTANVDFAG